MSTAAAQVGVMGMAVMGSSLARNMARHGYRTAIFNRTRSKTDLVIAEHGHEGTFLPAATVEQFVASLERPRRIVIMVAAGPGTDAGIDSLPTTPLTFQQVTEYDYLVYSQKALDHAKKFTADIQKHYGVTAK